MTTGILRFSGFALLAACAPAPRSARVETGPAESLVQRFLRADAAGQPDSAWALLRGCVVFPSADYLMPTLEATLVGHAERGDTVAVLARYVVLGKIAGGAPHGARYRFDPEVRVDTVRFPVVRDSAGVLAISCGYFPPVHPAVATLSGKVDSMDDSSRARWRAALDQASRLR